VELFQNAEIVHGMIEKEIAMALSAKS